MDRRQRKTREAIFSAFITLLAKKSFDRITVGEIIALADVGRATFYAHFETKDDLLRALCEELFDHVFESASGGENAHSHIFDCHAPDSVFLHLLLHLQKNDNHIRQLLSCPNNELFLRYFKDGLRELIKRQQAELGLEKAELLPEDFWINHVTATFVETVRWWVSHGMKESPETVAQYFLAVV
ncbi:MAG: TetR/AcrR family transcriptional regulator [Clostridia bacterium]|nr:TetR/AcrR family transcriptional regulator [Clostridia bacterium]